MTSYEKNEIKRLPRKYRPMGAWRYIFNSIFYLIPVIGWIFLFAHAFSDRKITRRSYARFYILVVLAVCAVVALVYFGVVDIAPILEMLKK